MGIDIDIRKHNRIDIETHPMAPRIQMLEGSSVNAEIVEEVKQISLEYKKVMVCLDSNHTHDHVLQELEIYAPMTTLEAIALCLIHLLKICQITCFPIDLGERKIIRRLRYSSTLIQIKTSN